MACQLPYYGATYKGLTVRIKEHKRDITTGRFPNALTEHMRDKNHQIDWENAQILSSNVSKKRRKFIESALIASNRCLNISTGFCEVSRSLAWKIISKIA